MQDELPYRTNAKPTYAYDESEPEPPVPFETRYPKFWKLVQWACGMVLIAFALGVIWVAFPGMYYFGGWLDRTFLHWELVDIKTGPSRWVVGWLAFFLASCMILLPRRLGKWLLQI